MKHNTYNYEGGQPFKVEAPFTPTGDQPTAIQSLTEGIERGEWAQVLLGATGTGKTFTMAKVIEAVQKPTLIIAHNKTLAAQLCSEFKSFFPNNAVEYFVSYYDFYQPEAYIPSSDTYIEKDASINDEIDKLRHSATMSLFERRDVIIVASVSCIYGLGDPEDYSELVLSLRLGQTKSRDEILSKLVDIQYTRNDMNFIRGTFRVQGDTIEIFPAAYSERAIRVELFGDEIDRLVEVDALTGEVIAERKHVAVYPASHYVTTKDKMRIAVERIEAELDEQLAKLKAADRLLEAQRLEQRTRYDIEMMQEMGYCSGIENYSRLRLIIDRFNSMSSWSVSIKSFMYRQRLVHMKWKYKRMWQSKLFVLLVYLIHPLRFVLLRDKWMTCSVKFISVLPRMSVSSLRP